MVADDAALARRLRVRPAPPLRRPGAARRAGEPDRGGAPRLAARGVDSRPAARARRPRRAASLLARRRCRPGLGGLPGGGHPDPRPPRHRVARGHPVVDGLGPRGRSGLRPRRLRHEGGHRGGDGGAHRHGAGDATVPGLAPARPRRGDGLRPLAGPPAERRPAPPSGPGARAVGGRRGQGGAQGQRGLLGELRRSRRPRRARAGEGRLRPGGDGPLHAVARGPGRRGEGNDPHADHRPRRGRAERRAGAGGDDGRRPGLDA